MDTLTDTSQQFAYFFNEEPLRFYAQQVFKKLSEGHICLDLGNDVSNKTISELKRQKFVGTDQDDRQPFILYNKRLYLQRYFAYETSILERIKHFVAAEALEFERRSASLLSQRTLLNHLFNRPIPPGSPGSTDWQMVAAIHGVLNNFTIITGGPGTGKTTTVAKILALLFSIDPGLKVALAAPTGKAATRMAESIQHQSKEMDDPIKNNFLQLQPSTIHRLLKMQPGTPYFRHNKMNPLPYDLVIVDEGSMIDIALFAKLLEAIGPGTRLIMLGDKDQLASVEAGSLFGDLCQATEALNIFSTERTMLVNSLVDNKHLHLKPTGETGQAAHPLFQHIIELRHSYRFSGNEGIGKFSTAVIRNDVGGIEEFFRQPGDEQVIIDHGFDNTLFDSFIEDYQSYIGEEDISKAIKRLNELRVLCAVREGEQGLYAINKKIERSLSQKRLLNLNGEYYEHRPVIITKNYYSLGLFNGDIGIIRPDEKGTMRAWFEDGKGGIKSVLPGYLSQVETVFAMTIHKSQGSEFNKVFVVLPSSAHIPILTRELLYTAVTRARQRIYIQGSREAIREAASRKVERGSGIIDRFQDHSSTVIH